MSAAPRPPWVVWAVWAVVGALLLAGCARVPLRPAPRGPLVQHVFVADRWLAYCASQAIESWTPQVRRVIVAVHGLDRNACGMRQAVSDGLGGQPADTVIVAPHFASPTDAVPGGHSWEPLAWPAGAESSAGVSSYAVLDALIASFGERRVTLVGFSGGGQFTNRYSAISERTLESYVVINPSTYLWFTPERPAPVADCPAWNDWRYGLQARTGYVGRATPEAIRARYAARDVRYLIGTADDDPRGVALDRSCGAMAQGANREERALHYHAHLLAEFGPLTEARQPLALVPGIGHDAAAMLRSDAAREALAR